MITPHFSEKKTETEKCSNWPDMTFLAGGGTRQQSQVSLTSFQAPHHGDVWDPSEPILQPSPCGCLLPTAGLLQLCSPPPPPPPVCQTTLRSPSASYLLTLAPVLDFLLVHARRVWSKSLLSQRHGVVLRLPHLHMPSSAAPILESSEMLSY